MLYELTCLINPDLNENEIGEFSDKLSKLLSESGKIIETASPKKIKLQYKIKKFANGFLLSFIFDAEPANLEDIKTQLDKDTEIIRFLLLKTRIEKEPKAPVIKKETTTPEAIDHKEKNENTEQPKEKTDKKEDKVAMETIETELNKILNESE